MKGQIKNSIIDFNNVEWFIGEKCVIYSKSLKKWFDDGDK